MWKALREHLKERFNEWAVGLGLLLWGAVTLTNPGYFNTSPAFTELLALASQPLWGYTAIILGMIRVVFLIINGTWRRSAHLRAVGSGLSAIFWASVFGSYLTIGQITPNLATVGALLALDMYSLWFAAEDAKYSDLITKHDEYILAEVKKNI